MTTTLDHDDQATTHSRQPIAPPSLRWRWMLAAVLFGCVEPPPTGVEDDEDAEFLTPGKADSGAILPGEFKARAVLRFVNTATTQQLKAAQLSLRVIENLQAVLAGDDETSGTSDDGLFRSLADLDAVPFVGPKVFMQLIPPALEAVPAVPTSTCQNPEWITTETPVTANAPDGTRLLTTADGVMIRRWQAQGNGQELLALTATGEWSRRAGLPPLVDDATADRLGLHALSPVSHGSSLRAPEVTYSTNWSGAWVHEQAISEDEFCKAVPFTCDDDPDEWFIDEKQVRLDERGFVHAAIMVKTRDDRPLVALVYVTNATGTWRIHPVARGHWRGAFEGHLPGTPETHELDDGYLALCTGKVGAAIVYSAHTGGAPDLSVLTVATLAGDTIKQAKQATQTFADIGKLSCDSFKNEIHIAYQIDRWVEHTVFDLSRGEFIGASQMVAAGFRSILSLPKVAVDAQRGLLHVVGEGVSLGDPEWRGLHISGPVGGDFTSVELLELSNTGFSNTNRDVAIDRRGAMFILTRNVFKGHLAYQQCH